MKSVTYTVICPFDPGHRFPVVLEMEDGSEEKEKKSHVETYCPFCDKFVRVTVEGQLEPDVSVMRGFGFEPE
jgi:hypothetical protein